MKTPKSDIHLLDLTRGRQIAEGKTKGIFEAKQDPDRVFVVSKDDITAGDGAKHDVLKSKAELATTTTCNVFRLLKACGMPIAFDGQYNGETFIAPKCDMLPYEVVVRREAHGSYLKRNPNLEKGHLFPRLVVEFYLKTKDKVWKGWELPCDDPLMVLSEEDPNRVCIYDAGSPIIDKRFPNLLFKTSDIFAHENEAEFFPQMKKIAREVFLILEKAWQIEGGRLLDFKVEFGLDSKGNLLLADVIDSDSWRVLIDGVHVDKQVYRDGGGLDEVLKKYIIATEITERFASKSKNDFLCCLPG